MSAPNDPPDEEEIFKHATMLPVGQRAAYLQSACAGRPDLLEAVARLLASIDDEEFMSKPLEAPASPEMVAEVARLKPEVPDERVGPSKLLAIGAGTTVVVALVAVIIASLRAENVAKQRLLEAEKARRDTKAVSALFAGVFESPDPARDGRSITVAETLDRAVKKLDGEFANEPARRAKLQATLASTYSALGLYSDAIPIQENVRNYYVATLGTQNADTLAALHELSRSYNRAGKTKESVKAGEELLALRIKTLGPENTDTLAAMESLAGYYVSDGRRDEAQKLREKLLALYRKVLGPVDQKTLGETANVAEASHNPAQLASAVKLREEVLSVARELHGQEHPDTLWAMSKLANSYSDAGRVDEALKLREEALPLSRKTIGPEHPDTLWAMSELANSYSDVGRLADALRLREEVLPLSRKINGPKHPAALAAMTSLAISYSDAGRADDALELREAVLPFSLKVLGPNHPDTLAAMTGLAISLVDTGRWEEALKLRDEVLAISRKVLGPEHPDTLSAMTNLANSYSNRCIGRWDDALKLREEVLQLSRKVLGPEHPDTLSAMTNLADSYHKKGLRDEAIKLREEVLQLSHKVRGPEHPDTLLAAKALADAHLNYHKQPEAEAEDKEHEIVVEGSRATIDGVPITRKIPYKHTFMTLISYDAAVRVLGPPERSGYGHDSLALVWDSIGFTLVRDGAKPKGRIWNFAVQLWKRETGQDSDAKHQFEGTLRVNGIPITSTTRLQDIAPALLSQGFRGVKSLTACYALERQLYELVIGSGEDGLVNIFIFRSTDRGTEEAKALLKPPAR